MDVSLLDANMTSPSGFSNDSGSIPFLNPFNEHIHIRVTFIVCYSIVFACCFFGNLLVLFVIFCNARMRSRTNFFLANLAVADFCVGIFCVFQHLSTFLSQTWEFGKALCKIYYFVQQTSYTASVVLLTIISVERYIAIMYPLRAKQLFTFHRLKVAQVIMWLLLAAYNCPQLIIFDIVPVWSSSTNTTVEFCYLTAGMTFMRIYNTSNFIVFYVVPFILMSIMYSKIATALWISGTDMNPAMNQQLTQHPPHNGTTRFSMPNRRFRYGTDVTLVSFKKNTIPPDEAGVAFECKNTEKQREFNNILLVNETADPIQNRGDSTSTETTTYDFLSEGFYSDAESEYGDAENNYRVHTTPPFNRKSSNKSNLSRKSSDNGKKISKHKHNQKVKYGVMRFTGKQLMDKRSHPSVKSCDSSNSYSSDRIRSKSTSRIPKTNSIKILQARRKVIRMLVAIVITFAVCVLPHHVRVLMTYWGTIHSSLFTPISVLILYLNSGMNPIVYALLSGTFRRSLRELFLCRRS